MSGSILTAGQRRLHVALVVVAGALLATSAYLFLRTPEAETFPRPYQAVLIAHIALGLLVLVPGVAFVLSHLARALATKNREAIASGLGLAVVSATIAGTGAFLVLRANATGTRPWLLSHEALSLALPLLYLLHRRLSRSRPPRIATVVASAGAIVVATFALVGYDLSNSSEKPGIPSRIIAEYQNTSGGVDPFATWGRAPGQPEARDPFFPSPVLTASGKTTTTEDLLGPHVHRDAAAIAAGSGAEACERCHQDIAAQWRSSAHRRSSFNNPFYAVAVDELRARAPDGTQRARWCAGCHDPAVMLTGRWDAPIDRASVEANAGLGCLSCHAIERLRDVGGNGGYVVRDRERASYLFADAAPGSLALELHDRLVRSKPAVHKREMLKSELHRGAEFCSTCHKVSLDVPVNGYRWVRGQDEYDAWHASGVAHNAAATFYLPPAARPCQGCHMPLVAAPLGDVAAKGGLVRSHRFAAANSALPSLSSDAAQLDEIRKFLEGSMRVDVFAAVADVASGARGAIVAPLGASPLPPTLRRLEVHVVVRNAGVGHAFPGGTLDSNDAWLAVSAKDDQGRTLIVSGALGDDGRVEAGAHRYRALMLDGASHAIDKRNPQDTRATVYGRAIGPGRADMARFALAVPPDARAVTIDATLNYRKFDVDYAAYALKEPKKLPVIAVARDSIRIDYVEGSTPPLDAQKKPELWMRWNDYGIALLDQGDTRAAALAFKNVTAIAPTRADGPRNEARVALRDGEVLHALAFLEKAEERARGDPQSAFFWGDALERVGRLDDALLAFGRALERFPNDREALRGLARVRWKKADVRGALDVYMRILAIDPEDRDAHYHRMLAYRQLGDEPRAADAARAYERFRVDEEAASRTREFRLTHAEANRESQAVHIH